MGGPKVPVQISVEGGERTVLDEDALFECFPTVRAAELGKLGVGQLPRIVRPLDPGKERFNLLAYLKCLPMNPV